jgi:predicted amidohydrolase
MKLRIVQFTPVFGDKEENFKRLQTLADRIATEFDGADLIVFPELCTTGYFFQSKEESMRYAETTDGETVEFFRAVAHKMDAMVVAGFAEKDGENVYNSALIVAPGQETRIYRKTHLFYKERHCFADGDTGFFVVPHHRLDAKVGVMICYDWRFPESARALGLKGADVIVCPSNLVTNVWHIAMPARALENKVYVAVPNRAGEEIRGLEDGSANGSTGEKVKFTGRSVIYGFNGQELAKAGEEADEILAVEIDPAATRDKSFNPLNDIFRDRRPEMYA